MAALNAWGLRLSQRTTLLRAADQAIAAASRSGCGILIGVWDESELPEELWEQVCRARDSEMSAVQPSWSAALVELAPAPW